MEQRQPDMCPKGLHVVQGEQDKVKLRKTLEEDGKLYYSCWEHDEHWDSLYTTKSYWV
jgi:hypothetical protein